MCEEATPVYDLTCDALLTDPEMVARELDELLIQWHAIWLREHPPPDDG